MPRNEERSPFDLRDLQRIMDSGTGPAEIPDMTPVLRADVLDGLQRYLAAQYRAHAILAASGYHDAIGEANAVLAATPGLHEFVDAMAKGYHAAAYVAVTAVHVD